MKSTKSIIVVIIVFIVIAASALYIFMSGGKSKGGYQSKLDTIKELEKVVYSKTNPEFNIAKAKALADAYVEFGNAYPEDTAAPTCYYNAARLYMNTINPNRAIELFDKIITSYPEHKKIPECMFLKAFTYDNSLKKVKKAEEAYNAFLKKYPDNEYADDAQGALLWLGKTDEEIAAELFGKNKADTVTSVKSN